MRAIASAAQRVSRYHRRASDLSLSRDQVEHLQQLHSTALQDLLDRKDLRWPPPVAAPTTSRARDYTVEAVLARGQRDDELIAAMGDLNADPAAQDQILSTLDWMDRRDQVEQARRDAADRAAEEASWHDDRADDTYEGLVDEPTPRETFAATMATTPGRRLSKREQAREDYERHLYNQFLDAELECRGHMLTREGEAKGIDPVTLWRTNRTTANRYASDELKSFWNRHGRLSLAEYRYQVLGWDSDRETATRRKDDFDAA